MVGPHCHDIADSPVRAVDVGVSRRLRGAGRPLPPIVAEEGERVVERVDRHDLDVGWGVLLRVRRVFGRHHEVRDVRAVDRVTFCSTPPISPTVPSGEMVPVAATSLPPVRSPGVSSSSRPSVNASPALGPPMRCESIDTSNGSDGYVEPVVGAHAEEPGSGLVGMVGQRRP